ncbi:MAG: HAMP domain-containing histidine kinase [Paludibacteraceae bacterium]|nr:HAMP domain-containing histidine kinase [Paludibacteraceae bacterium]
MRSPIVSWIIVLFALLFVGASAWFTHRLSRQFAEVEQQRMEIWAEATRQLVLADENTDISLYSSIIEANTTIPVYMTDADYRVILTRNVEEPKQDVEAFYERKIARLRDSQTPIEVRVSPEITQYIFYEQSNLLRQLRLFPWVQMAVVLSFMALIITYIITSYRNEQNRVWVGLSKETAHQLGTPISSLNGWLELLNSRYPNDELLPDIAADVNRLQLVAERFSRIGSAPTLVMTDIRRVVEDSYAYMRTRVSQKVELALKIDEPSSPEAYTTMADAPLMAWVVENLIKNSVDAMNGRGWIELHLQQSGTSIILDVTDTGRGIERKRYKQVFRPGYTTKTRGWGLGLSLCKRIVEEYHGGEIFVHQSVVSKGTTFRVILKHTIDR